ncbi:dehydrogenase [Novosphingobium barchaimii LL02]|uniref:Dehydrogenase n=1 Tax=Novosphingobium barchaimii LL02 TaxID=1114963 RepID=A0A0J7XY60_9SPHN|nr:sugar dehydrogenase complex small subunit [Novosphingobium barchaimii]KMS56208.1 dehydrogenase [Novosphingobium barchaimii LL02]
MDQASDLAFEGTGDIASGMTRRAFAIGTAVSLMLAACHGTAPSQIDGAEGVVAVPEDPVFLALSQAITGHPDLDPVIAARTAQAFRQLFPDIAATFAALAALARQHPNPTALLDATTPAQHEAALAIVAAWYTGTVGTGVSAQAIAYADALMNRPVADALFPPTYQLGGPAWWTASPPSVEISGTAARPNGARQTAGKSQK